MAMLGFSFKESNGLDRHMLKMDTRITDDYNLSLKNARKLSQKCIIKGKKK